MKPTMFFLMNSIELERGGLTRASLKQASFFAEMGYETYMLTFNFNPKYPLIRKKLVEMNKVHKDVVIRNMYEELEGNNEQLSLTSIRKASLQKLTQGLPFDKREDHDAYRVYNNGLYIKYISFSKKGLLDFIDYFNENRYRTKREVYDPWGNLKKVAYMDFSTNKPRQTVYYDNKGSAFFSQWNNPNNGKVQRIILFNKDGSIAKTFVKDDVSHKVDWLSNVVESVENDKSVIISDTRSTDDTLIKFEHPKAAKIWRLHSNHLDSPYESDSNILPKAKNAFNNIHVFDAAVFLTEEQKSDVINRIGEKDNIRVIPHFHEETGSSLKSLFKTNKRDPKLGVVISRLSTLKRIDHIIKAFEIAVKRVPDARLEIWGTGDQETDLSKLITELNLNDNVFLKGYTHTPDEVYQKGSFSVLTSKSEGFALSVLESMYNKTPAISYNIRYGPSDMIVNNDNGFLVENTDIEELAAKMIYLFENPSNAKEMGEKANKYIEKYFNKDIYKDKWLEVVDSAIQNKFGQ
ncbi:glycosyltransferase [Lentibacillus sediminis]|uniref:glycosyltransferase n=1 Tax=Lentibacillus sediminis TaxID=1940529 RepID=UPI000C1BEB31|nr:glycosyltransferase [Lentibacillus sediminis]